MRIRPTILPALLLALFAALAGEAVAEPFYVDPMPADFDGVAHPWSDARRPVAVDFDGDGKPSWYAGGNRVAHPKQPTPLDTMRYATAALPAISLPVCPSCTPRNLGFAVGDINRDGDPDIVRVNAWNGHSFVYTLQVFLGDGNDGFSLGWREDWEENPGFNSGDRFFQLALADTDRDGDPELVMLASWYYTDYAASPHVDRGHLEVRANNGAGFAGRSVIQAQHITGEASLLVGDFDRDGDVDLLVDWLSSWSAEDTVSFSGRLYAGDGDGGFATTTTTGLSNALDLADLDRDGWIDLVQYAGGAQDGLAWRRNNKLGAFFGTALLAADIVSDYPVPALAADLDEDGDIDLLSAEGPAYGQSPDLVLRRGNGSGGVAGTELLATFDDDIVHVGVGDAAGDDDLDLLVRLADGSFWQLRNMAPRLDARHLGMSPGPGLTGLTRLEAADSNRDGITEVFALEPGGNKLHRYPGDGSGGLGASEFKILASGPADFALGDFNRDGRTDAAYTVPGAGAVRTVLQNDSIYFGWSDSKAADYAGADKLRVGDGALLDGTPDLLVSSASSHGLRWLRNNGSATAWTPTDPVASQPLAVQGLALIRGYGGFADAAMSCSADGIALYVTGYSNLFGWYESANLLQVQQLPQTGVCAAANLDDDRQAELVLVDGIGRLVAWDPTSELTTSVMVIFPGPMDAVHAIRPVDWNRDGLTDLLVAGDDGLYLYFRDGPAESWRRRNLWGSGAGGTGAADVVAVDLDRDGLPDAVTLVDGAPKMARNLSSVIMGGPTTHPQGNPLVLAASGQGIAFATEVGNPGRIDEDANVAVTGASLLFRHAVAQGNGSFAPGEAMSKAEVQQLVHSVSLLVDGQLVGTAGSGAVQANGSIAIAYSLLGNVVPIQPGATRTASYRVRLQPDAAAAGIASFYLIQQYDTPGLGRVLHDGEPLGREGTFRSSNWSPARVVVQGVEPLPEALFGDGFE